MSTVRTNGTALGRVLVVDDDDLFRRVCTRTLQVEGWHVLQAQSAEEALERLRGASIDCVVSDVHLPGLDGHDFLRAIRRHDLDVPVLLMTGEPSLAGAVHAIDGGDTRSREVVACEALLRGDEPALGRPELVIGAAERLERVPDLGRAVRAAAGPPRRRSRPASRCS
jgi:CheY-like chemotaxis protein